jgi:hypothetical protein
LERDNKRLKALNAAIVARKQEQENLLKVAAAGHARAKRTLDKLLNNSLSSPGPNISADGDTNKDGEGLVREASVISTDIVVVDDEVAVLSDESDVHDVRIHKYLLLIGHINALSYLQSKTSMLAYIAKHSLSAVEGDSIQLLTGEYPHHVDVCGVVVNACFDGQRDVDEIRTKVAVKNHRGTGTIKEEYSLTFDSFNSFIGDVKLKDNKFYYEIEVVHIDRVAQLGWMTEGFQASESANSKGVGDDDFSWGFDGMYAMNT